MQIQLSTTNCIPNSDYADNYEEHVFILSGLAVLIPDDDENENEMYTIRKGDYVIFSQGFSCQWHVQEPMRKRFAYYDEQGEISVGNVGIACDECSEDCWEKSYFFKDMDICPTCFKGNEKKFNGAQMQHHGEDIVEEKTKKGDKRALDEDDKDEESCKTARS